MKRRRGSAISLGVVVGVAAALVSLFPMKTGVGAALETTSDPDTLRVEASIHPAVVKVGERVRVRVALALSDTTAHLKGPPAPLTLGDLDVLASEPAPAGPDSAAWRVQLALFQPGDRDLGDLPFALETKSGSRPVRLLPYTLTVESTLPDSADTAAIRDIEQPVAIPMRWRWGRIALVVSMMILAAAGIWLWRRRRKASPARILPAEPSVPPEEAALRALRELEEAALPARGLVKEHYARLSLLLREYLERKFRIPAVESTTDEIRRTSDRTRFLSSSESNELLVLLEEADLVKFARHDPGRETATEALVRARRWVESRMTPVFPRTGTEGGSA